MHLSSERVVKTGTVAFILYLGMLKFALWGGDPFSKIQLGETRYTRFAHNAAEQL